MRILLILRGPPGSGKSEVRKSLKTTLGMDNELLDLDQVIPEKFEDNLNQALKHDFVVGEMHYGNGHTTDPELWINRFKEKKYKILSIVLQVSLDTCVKRAICRQSAPLTPTDAINQFSLFYQRYKDPFQ
jgi:tRNA uridine 5-carbamoylmethylation protein Kti12